MEALVTEFLLFFVLSIQNVEIALFIEKEAGNHERKYVFNPPSSQEKELTLGQFRKAIKTKACISLIPPLCLTGSN